MSARGLVSQAAWRLTPDRVFTPDREAIYVAESVLHANQDVYVRAQQPATGATVDLRFHRSETVLVLAPAES